MGGGSLLRQSGRHAVGVKNDGPKDMTEGEAESVWGRKGKIPNSGVTGQGVCRGRGRQGHRQRGEGPVWPRGPRHPPHTGCSLSRRRHGFWRSGTQVSRRRRSDPAVWTVTNTVRR